MIEIQTTKLTDVLIIQPKIFDDQRGYLFETYNEKKLSAILRRNIHFVQHNISCSQKNVIRGLHFQKNQPQAKLISVIQGCIRDVVVDIRPDSPTLGQWHMEELSEFNHKQLFIPESFAHGFEVMSDYAIVSYHCSDFYAGNDQFSIHPLDESLNINWLTQQPILSCNDKNGEDFEKIVMYLK